ncbi:MAG: (Na+)-NQR maturation NqrM [Pseudomonadota bacterium]
MTTLLLAFFAMIIIVAGMAIGVMAGRAPISGSCGGIGKLGIDAECEICGGNPNRCESNRS